MKNGTDSTNFYLGNKVDASPTKNNDQPFLYDPKNLTTHAVCLGMTGSGKTGLGIALLEEAGLNKIPAIIIDPKGDLGDLLLTFPHLSSQEFFPWIDPIEADRKGVSPEKFAEETADTWREGLKNTHQEITRIEKLKDAVDMIIYTPANRSGVPISILRSFEAPPKELQEDAGAFRDRVLSLTSTLLGLLGINADPIRSREHILVSSIIDYSWRQGVDLDLTQLIQLIQKPPLEKIGALDMETFFPAKERKGLAINLNNLLAAPGFQAWMEGESLDVERLLYRKDGKPKFAIFSIAHLSDSERMFFVTLLLNEVIAWMRQQPGTSNLKALLYMDEILGFFPPSSMPPSKTPMLTLLKQARAYGVGVILATQNPVDLDYKGLANCGTWFIGRLQTDRDKARVTEGLKVASNGNINTEALNQLLAATGKRVFMIRSIYETEPILFKTRWTLSYLRGPLTLSQIHSLKNGSIEAEDSLSPAAPKITSPQSKSLVPTDISELYAKNKTAQAPARYQPRVLGVAKLHFVDTKNKLDLWREISKVALADDEGKAILWEESDELHTTDVEIVKEPPSSAIFDALPAGLMQSKNYPTFEKSFAAFLYQNHSLTLYHVPSLNLTSNESVSEGQFRSQAFTIVQQKQKEEENKIRGKFAEKRATLQNKLKIAQDKLEAKQQKSMWQKIEAFISLLTTLLGAFLGRGVTKGTISQAGTSLKRTGRMTIESQGTQKADETVQGYQKQLEELDEEMQKELDNSFKIKDPSEIPVETLSIRPRKGDITIEKMALLWLPL